MVDLKDACAIVGVGNTAYTRGTDRSTLELHLEASLKAIEDAGLKPSAIDAVMPSAGAGRCSEDFISNLGLENLAFTTTPHMGGASFTASVQSACMAVATGVATNVLVVSGRRGYSGERSSTGQTFKGPMQLTIEEFEVPYGSSVAVQRFAPAAARHMYEYGTTSEQLGHVAVTCRSNAQLNPQAVMHGRPMTLEDHQNSRMISTPFRLFDCSLESDGAGAVVITSAERARDLPHVPVFVSGVGESHSYPPTAITQRSDMAFMDALRVAGERAFNMAQVGTDDIDVLLVHEGFSWFVIAALEALGFVKPGEGGPFVEAGNLRLDGPLPFNPHGGALSEAHVSGVNHAIEAVRQLRRTVEPARQVADCEKILYVNEGNFFDGSVMVLSR